MKAFDLTLDQWKEWCAKHSLPPFAPKQIMEWIFHKRIIDPTHFSNLSKECRTLLAEEFSWQSLQIDSLLVSQDGSTKYLLRTHDNHLIEMVLMPYEKRATLCISSQIGCKRGCTFCQTGKMGFKRNLTSGEILEQLLLANQSTKITNVVFMGMGEPLDNYDNVVAACRIMVDPKGFALSKSRVTISTAGVVPLINRLARDLPLRLAISLHTADDEKRSRVMPINRTHNLIDLKEALLDYPTKDGITFEYVMISGVNDTLIDAKKLVRFIHGLKAKVNLIPLNHFPGSPLSPSVKTNLDQFQAYLSARSIPAPVRYSRGQDISGACGQLAAKNKDQLHLDPRTLRTKEESPILS